MAILDARNLSISFGGLRAVDGFDLKIEMNDFNREQAEEMCKLYDLKLCDLVMNSDEENFTISPSYLQALCLENIDKSLKKVD